MTSQVAQAGVSQSSSTRPAIMMLPLKEASNSSRGSGWAASGDAPEPEAAALTGGMLPVKKLDPREISTRVRLCAGVCGVWKESVLADVHNNLWSNVPCKCNCKTLPPAVPLEGQTPEERR